MEQQKLDANRKSNSVSEDFGGFKMTEIGELPHAWDVVPFENSIAAKRVQIGKVNRQDYKQHGLIPVVDQGQSPVAGFWDSQADAYAGALPVIVFGDHTRVFKFVDFPFVAGADGVKVLVPDRASFDPSFYYFACTNLDLPSRGYNRHYALLKEASLPCPPLPEQRAIARVLRTVQEAIEATERVIEAAKELKRSMMEYLFTYGPVPVDQADQVELKEKETDVGSFPSTWQVASLAEVASEPVLNGLFAKRERFGSGNHFVNVADTYKNSRVHWPSVERVQATDKEMGRHGLVDGDLLYVRSSLKREGVGNSILVEGPPPGATFDCHLMRVRLDSRQALPGYVNYYSRSVRGKQGLIALSKTTTMTTINQKTLGSFRVPLAMPVTQGRILRSIAAAEAKAAASQRTLDSLELLFQGFLHNLMTGKIRVTPTEADREAA